MISRRQLIGCGVAATALGVTCHRAKAADSFSRPGASVLAATADRLPITPAVLVVDERFNAARALASLAAPDIPRVAMPRDVFDLWHSRLEGICRSGGRAIAGVTTERGFFLLQTLAGDHRLRVLSRSAHAGSLVSWILGPR